MKALAKLAGTLSTLDRKESQKGTEKCTSGNSLLPAGHSWNISREKSSCAYPVVGSVCLRGFRTRTFIPSLQTVKTLRQMGHGQHLCDFLGEKPAGSASPSSWYVWCLVNVSTWWGVTGTEWAVQPLTEKYFKAKILIYCSLEVKQLLNIWFWHQALLCKGFFSKNSCVNW